MYKRQTLLAVVITDTGRVAQHGLTIDGKKLVLDQPIKSFGSYEVKARLGYEVSGTVYVHVIEEK